MRFGLIATALALLAASPAPATVFNLSYDGSASFFAYRSGTYYDHEVGYGTFEIDDSVAQPGIGNGLLGFNFRTDLTETLSTAIEQHTFYSSRTYGLSDVAGFSITRSGNQITSLFFNLTPGFLAFGGAGYDRSQGAGRPDIIGNLSAAVPEPTTWALMVIGFGAIAARLRRGSFNRLPRRQGSVALEA